MKFSFKKLLLILSLAVLILYPSFISEAEYIETYSTVLTVSPQVLNTKEDITYHSPKLEELAQAIKEYEGHYFNSVSVRNNNPGNLRYSPYQVGVRDGFAYFTTYNDGWEALLHQLTIAADGRSNLYDPEMNLYNFFSVYAPSFENSPNLYASTVIKQLGVSPETKLKEFLK